jgi:hypothetical protein
MRERGVRPYVTSAESADSVPLLTAAEAAMLAEPLSVEVAKRSVIRSVGKYPSAASTLQIQRLAR